MPKVDEKTGRAFTAVMRGEIETVREMLDAGVNPNAKNSEGKALLHYADAAVAGLLLERGADVDIRGRVGETALAMAATYGRVETVEVLLQHGADVRATNENDSTPLHCAAGSSRNGRELCELLIFLGADPNARTKKGSWPVHFAAGHGSVDACRLFAQLGFGSSFLPEDVPSTYLTPFQSAIHGNSVENAQFYMDEFGEDLNQRTLDGRPLSKLPHKVFTDMHAFLRANATVKEISAAIEVPESTTPTRRRGAPSPM